MIRARVAVYDRTHRSPLAYFQDDVDLVLDFAIYFIQEDELTLKWLADAKELWKLLKSGL